MHSRSYIVTLIFLTIHSLSKCVCDRYQYEDISLVVSSYKWANLCIMHIWRNIILYEQKFPLEPVVG
jgi:hypothetical protein